MENIEIPDDFYIYTSVYGNKYLCHKSCIFVNNLFSNCKFYYLHAKYISNEDIIKLRHICNINDEIEEKTYFVNNKFNCLSYDMGGYGDCICLSEPYFARVFTGVNNVNEFLECLNKNYPECIRNNDIKIALKD